MTFFYVDELILFNSNELILNQFYELNIRVALSHTLSIYHLFSCQSCFHLNHVNVIKFIILSCMEKQKPPYHKARTTLKLKHTFSSSQLPYTCKNQINMYRSNHTFQGKNNQEIKRHNQMEACNNKNIGLKKKLTSVSINNIQVIQPFSHHVGT